MQWLADWPGLGPRAPTLQAAASAACAACIWSIRDRHLSRSCSRRPCQNGCCRHGFAAHGVGPTEQASLADCWAACSSWRALSRSCSGRRHQAARVAEGQAAAGAHCAGCGRCLLGSGQLLAHVVALLQQTVLTASVAAGGFLFVLRLCTHLAACSCSILGGRELLQSGVALLHTAAVCTAEQVQSTALRAHTAVW